MEDLLDQEIIGLAAFGVRIELEVVFGVSFLVVRVPVEELLNIARNRHRGKEDLEYTRADASRQSSLAGIMHPPACIRIFRRSSNMTYLSPPLA